MGARFRENESLSFSWTVPSGFTFRSASICTPTVYFHAILNPDTAIQLPVKQIITRCRDEHAKDSKIQKLQKTFVICWALVSAEPTGGGRDTL